MTVEGSISDLVRKYPFLVGDELYMVIVPAIDLLVSTKIQLAEASRDLEKVCAVWSTPAEIAIAKDRVLHLTAAGIAIEATIKRMAEALQAHFKEWDMLRD